MSGHSKWSTIKRKKALVDSARGKVFTKAAKELIVAVKNGGGGDPDNNASLRLAIQKAKSVNMPNDNIKRAIQRALGGGEGSHIEEVTYEAYAQEGVALIIQCMTDNKNRTLPEIKSVVSKAGGNMAEKGSVAYLFETKGMFIFSPEVTTEDDIMELTLDYDVDDILTLDDGSIEVLSSPNSFELIKTVFDEKSLTYLSAEITMVPSTSIPIADKNTAEKIITMIDRLDELDDVQNVYGNFDIDSSIIEALDD
jgi:YebC/PmpR family DNA-binding regulatory protein